MSNTDYNLYALIIGVSIVLIGSSIAYLFQRKLFGKYRNKVKNTMDKE